MDKQKIKNLLGHLCLTSFLFLFISKVSADIVLDGSLGRSGALPGPHFAIGAELGQQQGNNLFHSFSQFNVLNGETATFSGPDTIRQIISRVTGGTVSTLNGTLRSTMPYADMYLLNPAGILIGENAQLDVPGSVYFSTANELHFSDHNQLTVTHSQPPLLSAASPTAFGFLSDTPAAITLQNTQLKTAVGKTLSLIAGNIHLENSRLQAEMGTLRVVSVAGQGVVNLLPNSQPLLPSDGALTLHNSEINTDGAGSGMVHIRAGQIELDNSILSARTSGDKPGQNIDIVAKNINIINGSRMTTSTFGSGKGGNIIIVAEQMTMQGVSSEGLPSTLFASTVSEQSNAGNAGSIYLTVNRLDVLDGAQIGSSTFGPGQGGQVVLRVKDVINLTGLTTDASASSGIFASAQSEEIDAGNAGVIDIETKNLHMRGGAQIGSATFGPGQGGIVVIKADTIQLANVPTTISVSSQPLKEPSGNAGKITINVRNLELTDGAQISSATFGSGEGGVIAIRASDTVSLIGSGRFGEEFHPSGISAASESTPDLPNAVMGKAGDIELTTNRLIILAGGGIGNTTTGSGQGGKTTVNASESIYIAGKSPERKSAITSASEEEGTGDSGMIVVNTPLLHIEHEGEISTAAVNNSRAGDLELHVGRLQLNDKAIVSSASQGSGNAGKITLAADNRIQLNNKAQITTQAAQGEGGDIIILVPYLLYASQDSAITTSVKGGAGSGGNIMISKPIFIVLNEAKIIAQAVRGKGGNILVVADSFLKEPNPQSVVDASSELGIAGEVVIRSPDNNISGTLIVLPGEFLNAVASLKDSCKVERKNPVSRFVAKEIDGLPASPDDLIKSVLIRVQCLGNDGQLRIKN